MKAEERQRAKGNLIPFQHSGLQRRSISNSETMMEKSSRKIDRKKIYAGVFFLCLAVLMMLVFQESSSLLARGAWILPLGIGLLLYIWGRFFSGEEP